MLAVSSKAGVDSGQSCRVTWTCVDVQWRLRWLLDMAALLQAGQLYLPIENPICAVCLWAAPTVSSL